MDAALVSGRLERTVGGVRRARPASRILTEQLGGADELGPGVPHQAEASSTSAASRAVASKPRVERPTVAGTAGSVSAVSSQPARPWLMWSRLNPSRVARWKGSTYGVGARQQRDGTGDRGEVGGGVDRVQPAVAEGQCADTGVLEAAGELGEGCQQGRIGDEVDGEDGQRPDRAVLGSCGVGLRRSGPCGPCRSGAPGGASASGAGGACRACRGCGGRGGRGAHGFSWVWARDSVRDSSLRCQRSSTCA